MHPGSWATEVAEPSSGAAPAASSATSTARPAGPAVDGGSPFPTTGATARATVAPGATDAGDDEDEDEAPAHHRHPYTWLHLVVLALVAFVLGFLIVALWNQGKSNGAEGGTGAVGVVVLAPPASSYAA